MYLKGCGLEEIAALRGVSRITIHNDLKFIQKQWQDEAVRDFDQLKGRELARVDKLENEYWTAWERSQKPLKAVSQSKGTVGKDKFTKETKRLEQRVGDPRYLDGVYKCIERRCRLLGLDAPFRAVFTRDYDPMLIRSIVTGLEPDQRNLLTQAILEGKDPIEFAKRLKA